MLSTAARLLAASFVLLSASVFAGQSSAPPGGQLLVGKDDLAGFEIGPHGKGSSQVVEAKGQGFSKAIRVQVNERGQMWDVEIGRPLPRKFAAGEVLLMRAWIRNIRSFDESGQALATFQVAMRKGPWSSPISRVVSVAGDWKEYWIPGKVESDFGPEDLFVKLSCGEARQTMEIGGVELWVYPPGTSVDAMPRTLQTYAGREPDAPWRAKAAERIRQLRTAPLEIRVIDPKGRPQRDLSIKAEMVSHAFQFGSAVSARDIAGPDKEAAAKFRAQFLSLFNSGSFYNDLKWPAWWGEFGEYHNRPQAMEALRWFRSQGIPFRGHVLIWPGFRNLPSALQPDASQRALTGEEMHQVALAHFDDILGATEGYVEEWDVINEPRDNHDIMDAAGRGVMIEWFKRARLRAPKARLTLNDYSILPSRFDGEAIKAYEANARFLLRGGAPLDVLGLQGHMGGSYNPPERLLQILDRFAKFKKPIRVTEFTMRVEDEELAHDYARDFLTVMFSHPSLIGVQTWGPHNMFRADGSLTGAGRAWMDLVRGQWWTRASGKTNSKGAYQTTGCLGRYRVEIEGREFFVTLTKDSGPFTLVVP